MRAGGSFCTTCQATRKEFLDCKSMNTGISRAHNKHWNVLFIYGKKSHLQSAGVVQVPNLFEPFRAHLKNSCHRRQSHTQRESLSDEEKRNDF